jgi:hypothetical protein
MGATYFTFDERVSAEQLRYDDEEQGRDPLEVIIGIAIQLGIEQGRRVEAEPIAELKEAVRHYLEAALRRVRP